ncbi:MAG: F0F1 ATP synthase subunit B [Thermoleophilia bacterium]|nr:F0F1 ATP synthase subunit B [Thermoleophilia bacterium]MDH3724296.1 F0F1 ATP synthase subunit B [Thermoleophilia bacterium]
MALPLIDIQQIIASSDNPLLSPQPGLMIWTLVMFLITLFILKRYVFGPVAEFLEARRAKIAEDLNQAESSRAESERLVGEYNSRLEEARRESDELRERGRKDGERQGSEIVSAAQEQRERVLADADERIAAQTREASSQIRDDVVDLTMMAAEKVTRRTLSDDEHRRLIEEALAEADLSKLK